MISALKKYEKRKAQYNLLLKKQQKRIDKISTLRLVIFVLGLAILIGAYILRRYYLFDLLVLVVIVLFCYLAYLHKSIENKNKYIAALYEVNESSIKRLKGDWKLFEDTGGEFIDENHNYSYDLDIFGRGSLFQWINVARTYMGRQKLKEMLTEKPQNEQNIYYRQSAVKELEKKIYFRQRLEAEGKIINNLGEERVCNNLKLEESYQVMLITGSNMSGKSTFMRTVGINIVLAYAGAPVCADEFYCTIMDLYSCMKVSDNLGQSISSFYAEILKIKNIVKASKEGKQVLFLLDEILKGTNSRDRHTGAMILVKQLSKIGNLGFVSTHDLELGELENHKNSKVKNYHFSEYYRENKIYFDYKLKAGVSPTRNAVYLMKLAGIEI